MDKPEENGDPKAKADREKFESITKVTTSPVILKGIPDPEEAMAARKAAKKAKRDPNTQA
jgi:hypothetical protein